MPIYLRHAINDTDCSDGRKFWFGRFGSVEMALTAFFLLIPSLLLGQSPGPERVPTPITIKHTWGQPPAIPQVPRDKVICFALYTVQDNLLKLSAQLYPLKAKEPREVYLEIKRDGQWNRVATERVDEKGWLATFRIDHWNHTQDWPYRVAHRGGSTFGGLIRRDPREKSEIVVAAFTGNSNTDRGPRSDIISNIKAHDPDLLFFSGDQSYDHKHHLAAWLLFGRQFGEIIKNRPTITIPDDHDVGQGNLWGQGGKVSHTKGGDDGGYVMPADYVNRVQRAQTSHLPDPFDPTPIAQEINVYYTSLNVGGIDFAIIEDRKWKTGPAGLVPQQGPRPDHINNPDYDPATVDLSEARLLGERQLQFLRDWGQNWRDALMKVVLSQTIFAGGAHIHGKHDARLHADLDSNGWPQAGRARALRELRRCFAFHIAGDQHLATVIHHGINDWQDSGYSFCVPSIVNYYGRWWWPLEAPSLHDPQSPLPFTGRCYDGFRNKLVMHAYANPTASNDNAAGYGLVRLNKSTREITMECWPRHVDVSQPGAQQFPGWPITIQQEDNYGRQAMAYLPTIRVAGGADPVVKVVDEALGEVVYSQRISGATWRPKVFRAGSYAVEVQLDDNSQLFSGIPSIGAEVESFLDVQFD